MAAVRRSHPTTRMSRGGTLFCCQNNKFAIRAAAGFAERLQWNLKVLADGGLDEELVERFLRLLKDTS